MAFFVLKNYKPPLFTARSLVRSLVRLIVFLHYKKGKFANRPFVGSFGYFFIHLILY